MKTKYRIKKAGTTVFQTFPEKKCCLVFTRLSVLNFCFPASRESEILRQETKREQT